MSVTIRSLDGRPFEDFSFEVDLDLASVNDVSKIVGVRVSVEFNGEGKITVLTASGEDAEALCKGCLEEIEARSNLLNSFINGF